MDTSPKSAIDEGGAGRGPRRRLPPRGIARPERTSTSQYPFTWMAASKPQSTLSRSWAASLEQMNKGETGQSKGEKTTSAKKKFKTVDATTARRCLRSVGFRGSSQAFD
jgi:hypothetical protein